MCFSKKIQRAKSPVLPEKQAKTIDFCNGLHIFAPIFDESVKKNSPIFEFFCKKEPIVRALQNSILETQADCRYP